ncbi:MAG: ABC transporter substrate-binding protein [Tildeniella nuda ZEHNDER 1965/U140]|jgi:multiple sugar transport system substrate-binding protein|nr:ABC transporter substrate-binding protein [Tildeniella nuda ZEHNDER 1965/U140]
MLKFRHYLTGCLLCFCLLILLDFQVAAAAPNVTRLTLWQGVNPPPNRAVLERLVDQFNREHPAIQVESLYVGQSDQQLPKILAAIVGNAAPDLLWYSPLLTGQLVELDALRPLDDWLNNSPLRQQLDPALFESMTLENHLWSIPFGTNNVGIFYRPSLFRAAGITQLPQTWTEFRQVAQRLTRDTNGDGRIDQHGLLLPLGKGEWTVFMWLPFLWSGGGDLERGGWGVGSGEWGKETLRSRVGEPKTNVQLVSSGAIAALQFWRDLIEDGSAVLSAPERGYELDSFLAGKVAMQLSGPWTLGQLEATGVEFGVLPIPRQVIQATAIGGENLFLLKTTPARERAAQVFAEYVLSEGFQTQWAIDTGYLPTNLRSRQSEAYQAYKAKRPAVEVFLSQAASGRSRPIFPGYNRLSEQLGRAIEATLLGRGTPLEALTTAQKRLDSMFSQS